MTWVSILVQNITLWTAVFATGGIPSVSWVAVGIFCIIGTFQMGVRLLAYTGVLKIGASRSSSYSTSPCSEPGIGSGQSSWNVRT